MARETHSVKPDYHEDNVWDENDKNKGNDDDDVWTPQQEHVNMGKEDAWPHHLPKRSLRSPTNWLAVLLLDILWLSCWWQSWPLCLNFHWLKQLGHLVKPTMSAKRMETLSIVFILNGLNIVLMSPWKWNCWIFFQPIPGHIETTWLEDLGEDIFLIMLPVSESMSSSSSSSTIPFINQSDTCSLRLQCAQLMMTRTKGCQEKSSRQ